jgi:hypothetical protein
LHRETLETVVRTLAPEHPGTLQAHTNLARTLIREGCYAEAEKIPGRLSTPSFVIWARSVSLAWMHCSNSGTKVQTQQCEAASLIRSRFIHHVDARRFGDSRDKGLRFYRGYPESKFKHSLRRCLCKGGPPASKVAGHPRPANRVEPRKLPLAAPRITPGLLAPFALGSLSGEIQDQLSKLTHTA